MDRVPARECRRLGDTARLVAPMTGDLAGKVFGRLTVLRRMPGKKVQVRCICGMTKIVWSTSLRQGLTRSCGCLRRERSRENGLALATADPEAVRGLLNNPDLTLTDISDQVGVSRERVRQIAKRFGVTGRQRELVRRNTRFMAEAKAREAGRLAIFDRWQKTGECDGPKAARIINDYLATCGQNRCSQCNTAKDLELMSKVKGGRRRYRCNACNAANSHAYYHRKVGR